MTPCRKCRWAIRRSNVGFMGVLAAVVQGWKGCHFHRVKGKWVFLDGKR